MFAAVQNRVYLANSGTRVRAIIGADFNSERRVDVDLQVDLSFVGCVVVAVELVGVVVLKEVGEFVVELEHLRGGLVGEVVRRQRCCGNARNRPV